jgi:hypothetical protein
VYPVRTIRTLVILALVACHSPSARQPLAPSPAIARATPPQNTDLDSHDILARTPITSPVLVKHVLLGWAELAPNYHGQLDPRAAKRTRSDAAKLAEEVEAKLRANPGSIDALIDAHSEDPGSLTKEPYTVTDDGMFLPEFKNLAQRLGLDEVGIVTTQFGYDVILRVAERSSSR